MKRSQFKRATPIIPSAGMSVSASISAASAPDKDFWDKEREKKTLPMATQALMNKDLVDAQMRKEEEDQRYAEIERLKKNADAMRKNDMMRQMAVHFAHTTRIEQDKIAKAREDAVRAQTPKSPVEVTEFWQQVRQNSLLVEQAKTKAVEDESRRVAEEEERVKKEQERIEMEKLKKEEEKDQAYRNQVEKVRLQRQHAEQSMEIERKEIEDAEQKKIAEQEEKKRALLQEQTKQLLLHHPPDQAISLTETLGRIENRLVELTQKIDVVIKLLMV